MLIDYDVLLLPVFQEMRRLGAELSLSDYLLAIQTLRSGIGLENAAMLEQTCRLLWAKSHEEQEIFDTAFAEKVVPLLEVAADISQTETDSSQDPPDLELFPNDNEDASATDHGKREYEEGKERSMREVHTLPLPTSSPTLPPSVIRKSFHFMPRLPLAKNKMIGHWRQLRRMQAIGPVEELDIEKTIADICQWGTFRRPIMHPRHNNTARLVLLVDQGGSMVPFKLLTEALTESAIHEGLPGKTMLYYFHNCPGSTLYRDARLGQPVPLEFVLNRYARNSSVLIISDAGAARAHYDNRRINETKVFLQQLHSYTYLYAWLNPVPCYRWRFTTAEDIAQLAPMYPLDRDGLDDAITILRGHPFPPGVRTYV
jgi:uncharacterized protein with von Willebrand factor type A (vWA) domain